MTEVAKGDYVSFKRVVKPAVNETYRDAAKKAYKVEKEPARWIDQSGSGLVLKVSKTAKKIGDEKHRTARVDAGQLLGVLTVSLDDAEIVGVQQALLDLYDYKISDEFASMYDSFGDHA